MARALTWAAFVPAWLSAQATPTVPPNHPVYAFVDRLVAAGLVETAFVGQRAMSRREIARIIAEARRAGPEGWLAARLDEVARAFPDSGNGAKWVAQVDADVTALDSPARGIEPDANGSIDVAVNPLTSNQGGREIADGLTLSYRAAIAATVTPWLAIGGAERDSWLAPRGTEARGVSQLEQAYARALWRNVALTIGRDALYLGQADQASLAISMNARAVDQVRLSSDRPFVLPWLLRLIGPVHATIALGDLGSRQQFPHTRLVAYKASARPHGGLELGAGLVEQVGGQGSPPGTFLQKATDAFPLIDAVALHRNLKFSNKFVFADMRYVIPGVPGAQFYVEATFDDFDLRRVRSVFTEDAGYVWGLSGSCFAECGPVRAAVEYHVTGIRFYTHGEFANGFTVDNDIIGGQLGPRSLGLYTMVDLDGHRASSRFAFAYEDRSADKYGSMSTTPDDSDFHLVLLEHHPAERRWRTEVTVTSGRAVDRTRYSLSFGGERVENFGRVDGAWRTNLLARIGVSYRLTPFF